MIFDQQKTNNLSFKLNYPLIVISLICLAILTFISYENSLKHIEEVTQNEAQHILDTIVIAAETNNTAPNMIRIVNTLSARKNIERISLIHNNKQIIADNNNEFVGEPFLRTIPNLKNNFEQDGILKSPYDFSNNKIYHQTRNVNFIDPDVNRLRPYTIYLAFNQQESLYYANRELSKFVSIYLTSIIIILLTIYFLQKRILIKPITSLINTLEKQKNSKIQLDARIYNNDELGTLSQQYNELNKIKIDHERELDNTRKYIDGITHEIPVGLAYMDNRQCYRFVNKNYERWFGHENDFFIGTHIKMILDDEAYKRILPNIESALNGTMVTFESEVTFSDGSTHTLHVTYTPDFNASKNVLGFFICLEDITDSKESDEKLERYMSDLEFQAWALEESKNDAEEAKRVAEQAAQGKSDFLSTMSHEIRTPMNGVIGMAELLSNTKLDETQNQYVHTILNSGNLLITIINDILDYSKLEANKVSIENIPFNLHTTIYETLDLMQQTCSKNIEIKMNYPKSIPHVFIGDPARVRQILFNLTGNAIKFTEHGHVCIHVEKQDNLLIISVEDTGIGISEEQQKQLFESFNQADSSTTRKYGGTGLGLAISKRLAILMNGNIDIKSTVGKGTTFKIKLPLEVSSSIIEDSTPDAPENITQPLHGHILLVEDNLTNQLVASAMLKDLGISFDIAKDGVEALEKWRSNNYDLVYMDCRMPNMDGYEATRIIQSEEQKDKHTPIIALTANATPEDRHKCEEAGMEDILTKPFYIDDLRRSLRKWLYVESKQS